MFCICDIFVSALKRCGCVSGDDRQFNSFVMETIHENSNNNVEDEDDVLSTFT